MLTLEDFRPISLEAKEKFYKHYRQYPASHSENVFSTMVSWMHYIEYKYYMEGQNLVILGKDSGGCAVRPPSGPRNDDLLRDVVMLAKDFERRRPIVAVKEEHKPWLNSLFPDMKFTYNPDYFDYVYLANDLAELKGGDYANIRKQVNRFRRKYNYKIETICGQNIKEVNEFLGRWCLWRDCESDDMLASEREAILFAMENCIHLDLQGICMRVGSNIEAISVFEEMNPETAIVHFEKAMPDYEGIYQAINMETAKRLAPEYRFINRESDLGIAGLRRAKKRYRPHHMEKVSYVKKQDLGALKLDPQRT